MSKEAARIRRSKKLRANLHKNGIMRISISKSLKNITAQLIDSSNGAVLTTISTQQKAFSGALGGNIEAAKKVGNEIAKKALDLGHKKVTFDRSGYKYHGRVKALAEAARDGGLEF
tara:strand:- start:729 stop:1076 length:348 start_codon:yes stop_codon:yes gene_type:complete